MKNSVISFVYGQDNEAKSLSIAIPKKWQSKLSQTQGEVDAAALINMCLEMTKTGDLAIKLESSTDPDWMDETALRKLIFNRDIAVNTDKKRGRRRFL